MSPFFSIITVTRNDAWSLLKTTRSMFRQSFTDFEYLVVDGNSTDSTTKLMDFWQKNELITNAISEPDTGVYNAMNKALKQAKGKFVCFLNASDVFENDNVLKVVYEKLQNNSLDGILGWGELNGQVWASWAEGEAFKLSSLGFCHQSLFVKRELLLQHPFDERTFKTDSDTLQMGRLYASGAKISILPEVLAVRGGEPGISANIERTKVSITSTLLEEYPSLTATDAEQIIAFRRQCVEPEYISHLMDQSPKRLTKHLGYMVLDTLFQKPSCNLSDEDTEKMVNCAKRAIATNSDDAAYDIVDRLVCAQTLREKILCGKAEATSVLKAEVAEFKKQEDSRFVKLKATPGPHLGENVADVIVSLTSFPARISTLPFVIRSLIQQTRRPREIHIWLGRDEIPNKNWLPSALLEFERHGLHINFADKTFHQYDKFLHNYHLNEKTPFIIVDDDVIYPPCSIENLVETHQKYPDAVVANRCHKIGIKKDGTFEPYATWEREVMSSQPSLQMLPTGAGGVLYPPGFLTDGMAVDIPNILSHAPYADDIWLKACALARAIPTMPTPLSQGSKWYHRYTPTMQAGTLMATNVTLGLNDIQFDRCTQWLDNVRPNWRDEFRSDSEG